MLTLEKLKEMAPGTVFAKGTVKNEPRGVYITDSRLGDELLWVAKRGGIHDWAIYIHWAESGEDFVLTYGDKLNNENYIKELVPCNNEAYEQYRH